MFERNKPGQSNQDAEVLSIDGGRDDGNTGKKATSRTAAEAGKGSATVIGRSVKFNGELQSDEDMRIEGEVTGTIQLTNSTLTATTSRLVASNASASLSITFLYSRHPSARSRDSRAES